MDFFRFDQHGKIVEHWDAIPHVPSAKLKGYGAVYKIKLRTAGYRLAYEVIDEEIVVYALAIGKRDKDAISKKLASRTD